MNYGETLAYWYLRLNGFFPIVDYVLHHDDETIPNSADCDILAVRLPHVHEYVGGQQDDWDPKMMEWGLDIDTCVFGIIVEVKTGQDNHESRENIKKSFSVSRLEYAIQRLGFWPAIEAGRIARLFEQQPHYFEAGFGVIKLLTADKKPRFRHEHPWHFLNLRDVDDFIQERINRYGQQKYADRLRFPADLMQYMIWKKAGQDNR